MRPPEHQGDNRTLFWFGVSLSGVCFAAAGLAAWRGFASGWVWAGAIAGAVWLVLNVVLPSVREPAYRLVRHVTHPIHVVVTFVLLGIIFYLLITPVGLLLRVRGRDTMSRRSVAERPASFWNPRPGRAEARRYFKMF